MRLGPAGRGSAGQGKAWQGLGAYGTRDGENEPHLAGHGGAGLGRARGPTARHTLSQKGKRCRERSLNILRRLARS